MPIEIKIGDYAPTGREYHYLLSQLMPIELQDVLHSIARAERDIEREDYQRLGGYMKCAMASLCDVDDDAIQSSAARSQLKPHELALKNIPYVEEIVENLKKSYQLPPKRKLQNLLPVLQKSIQQIIDEDFSKAFKSIEHFQSSCEKADNLLYNPHFQAVVTMAGIVSLGLLAKIFFYPNRE